MTMYCNNIFVCFNICCSSSHSAVFYRKSMNLSDFFIVFYSLINNDCGCTDLDPENYIRAKF